MPAKAKKSLSQVQPPVLRAGASAAAPSNGTHPNGGGARERIAIVRGVRTPFAHRSTAYREMSALDLGRLVVRELLARAELDPGEVDLVVYGQVVPSLETPNIAREIVLGTGMPRDVQAFSVSRACATSFQAMTSAAEAMLAGQCAVAVIGGADSESDAPLVASKALARALREAARAHTLSQKVRAFAGLSPRDLLRARSPGRSSASEKRSERSTWIASTSTSARSRWGTRRRRPGRAS